jgi:hypothetical protein
MVLPLLLLLLLLLVVLQYFAILWESKIGGVLCYCEYGYHKHFPYFALPCFFRFRLTTTKHWSLTLPSLTKCQIQLNTALPFCTWGPGNVNAGYENCGPGDFPDIPYISPWSQPSANTETVTFKRILPVDAQNRFDSAVGFIRYVVRSNHGRATGYPWFSSDHSGKCWGSA